jgi:membrane protein YqaA with SNARE-associated domain
MRIFTKTYEKMMVWARHKHAAYYLGLLSFFESNISPILPDVMLGPMALAHPDKAWRYAFITTAAGVAGGILAYFVGLWAFAPFVEPMIRFFGWHESYVEVQAWLNKEILLVILFACLTPTPYKLFAFAAGSVAFNFPAFILASFLDRGMRFYAVSGLMLWGGEKFERQFVRYLEWIGWGLVVLLVGGYFIYRWLS